MRVKIYTNMPPLNEEPIIFELSQSRSVEATVPGYGREYIVEGVGPHKSIVAYSAICQHFGCPYPALKFYPPGQTVPLARSEIVARGGGYILRVPWGSLRPLQGHCSIAKSPPETPPLR
ncbi:MAG: hypothetical protein P3X22_006215 [Thermoprotei archaeon]|nr:hypothetical protein [Thermoprotei archaeon]